MPARTGLIAIPWSSSKESPVKDGSGSCGRNLLCWIEAVAIRVTSPLRVEAVAPPRREGPGTARAPGSPPGLERRSAQQTALPVPFRLDSVAAGAEGLIATPVWPGVLKRRACWPSIGKAPPLHAPWGRPASHEASIARERAVVGAAARRPNGRWVWAPVFSFLAGRVAGLRDTELNFVGPQRCARSFAGFRYRC